MFQIFSIQFLPQQLDRDVLHLVDTPEEFHAFISEDAEVASKTMGFLVKMGQLKTSNTYLYLTMCVCVCVCVSVYTNTGCSMY